LQPHSKVVSMLVTTTLGILLFELRSLSIICKTQTKLSSFSCVKNPKPTKCQIGRGDPNYLKHWHPVHVGFVGEVHNQNRWKIVKTTYGCWMSPKYVFNSSTFTLCSYEINIVVLLQL